MLQTLNVPLEEFLRPFFEPKETICLRVFDDKKTGTFRGMKLETTLSAIGSIVETLRIHNAKNRGIYFVVNYGGHEDDDISRINAQFVECDDVPLVEQMARIEAFPLEPSLIVKTRKSLHTYWLMKGADVASFRRVQKRLIAHFNGDKSCVNESRVLRLPGFQHCKEEPVRVECIKFHPELRYTQAELEAHLPQLEEQRNNVPRAKGTRKGLTLLENRCDFIQHCRDNAASLAEHDWYAMITNLAVFEDGDKAIHCFSETYPGYDPARTQEKIQHFLASRTKPITCATIAEKGFRCPRLASGDCSCKSPAALCYQALGVDELRTMLLALPSKASVVDNMAVAQDFIRTCMYNIEPAIACAFIEYELKNHFAMKAGGIKPLITMHRELYRAHQASKETKREAAGEELPEWYEPTGQGGLHFLSGLLADYMAKNIHAFYGAGSYFN